MTKVNLWPWIFGSLAFAGQATSAQFLDPKVRLKRQDSNYLKCSSGYCLPTDYNKLEMPIDGQEALDVGVELDVQQVIDADDSKFTVTFLMDIEVTWPDPRIIYMGSGDKEKVESLDLGLLNYLWVPDIYIHDLKSVEVLDFVTPFAGLKVANGTTITFSQETQVNMWCSMRFEKFPLDIQTCKFRIGSFSYDKTKMKFHMNRLQHGERPRTAVLDYTIEINPLKAKDKYLVLEKKGNFSVTGFELTLNRHSLKYFVNYYLSAGIFVVVSWVSFLIPPMIVPGRMGLLVTLLLVLTNIFNTVTINSPNVEQMSSVTAWIVVCLLFLFGALAGYAGILFVQHRRSLKVNTKTMDPDQKLDDEKALTLIDLKLLVAFPLTFLLFNLIYWPGYLMSAHPEV